MKVPNLENVHIIFHHQRPKDFDIGIAINRVPGYTICKIFKGDDLLVEGRANCSLEDNFARPYGRRLSCFRAMDNDKLTQQEKIAITDFIFSFPSDKRYFKCQNNQHQKTTKN